MLIITNKHTKADLECWKGWSQIDSVLSSSIKLKEKEERALNTIYDFSKNGNVYCGVSWGKDSVVVADLIARNGINIPVIHLYCNPSHNNMCDMVRDNFLSIYPNTNYHEIECNYGDIYSRHLPAHIQDKETDKVWFATWKFVSKQFGEKHISGVRSEESNIRKLRMMKWGTNSPNTCAPIGYWSTRDVFAYLHKYDLPVHPNYGMLGGGRWNRDHIRTAELGDIHGNGIGRTEWEKEYYLSEINKIMM